MEEKLYSVYRHISPSGKVYVGITCQPVEHRWNHGRGYMNLKKTIFKSTIIKYGWDNIKHEVLFTGLPEWRAKKLEISLIRHYKRLGISLNVTDGGDGCHGITPWNKGIKIPESLVRRGYHFTEEQRRKMSLAHKGKHIKGHKWTESQRAKLIPQMIGRHRAESTKTKISEHSAKSRKVLELDNCGNVINSFVSATEAGRFYGIDSSWVSKACNKRLKCAGHIFMHEDDVVTIKDIRYGRYRTGNSVQIKNKETNEVKEFHSESSCARFLGIKSNTALRKAIKKGHTIKGVWEIIKYKDEEVFKGPEYTKNKPKPLVCKNICTNEVVHVPSISECRRFLGLRSDAAIQKALHGIRSNNVIKGWEVKYAA